MTEGEKQALKINAGGGDSVSCAWPGLLRFKFGVSEHVVGHVMLYFPALMAKGRSKAFLP